MFSGLNVRSTYHNVMAYLLQRWTAEGDSGASSRRRKLKGLCKLNVHVHWATTS